MGSYYCSYYSFVYRFLFIRCLGSRFMIVKEIKKLNSRHRQVMRAILAGRTRQFIVDQTGISESQYERIIRSTIFIEEKDRMQDDIRQEAIRIIAAKEADPVSQVLKEGELPAAKKMVGLLDSKDEKISQTSAMELLDIGGRKPKAGPGIDARSLTFVLEGKQADNIARALEDTSSGNKRTDSKHEEACSK